jgi:hypothetical protein
MPKIADSRAGGVIKSSKPICTLDISVCETRLSGVKCGIDPLEEVAVKHGRGRGHLNLPLAERAISLRETRGGSGVQGREEEALVDIVRNMRRRGVEAFARGRNGEGMVVAAKCEGRKISFWWIGARELATEPDLPEP